MLRCLLLVPVVLAWTSALCSAELSLSADGKTPYTIVVDPDATAPEKHAADELASFLKQVTGADFPLQPATSVGPGPAIVVGPGRAARALAPNVDFDGLKPDGLVMETRAPHLILAGDRPRGTLYAVYTFLEDVVGCRWWSSKAAAIPQRPALTVDELHERFVPVLEYREPFWFDAFDPDWAVRNKYNGMRPPIDEQRGGHITYAGWFVHTFSILAPPKEHFAAHPEWFSEIDGQRLGGDGERVQLCLTNDELKDFVVQRVREWFDDHPDSKIISVSQNDWRANCRCEQCRALDEAEGSPAGSLIHFVNYIAERIAETHPDVAIDTLAYQYTRKPPQHVKPLPNVIVRLCSIECNFLQPLGEGESNAAFREDIEGWSKICDRLYIWDYTTNFGHYIMPHPNLRVLGPNVRFFVRNGVKGIFEQGAYQSYGAEFAELRAWVLAKLLWDPSRDPQALIEEFVNGYYGPAAPHILTYINRLHDEAEASGHYLGIGSAVTAPFLSLTFMGEAEKLLDRAEAAVRDEPDLLTRVEVARLPLRYVWAMRWFEFKQEARHAGIDWPGPADYEENCRLFVEIARNYQVTKLSEGQPIESFEKRTIGLGRRDAEPPPGCENLDPDEYVDFQDASFRLYREGTASELTHDDQASDGVAARTRGDHLEWAVQQPISGAGIDAEATYTVYVSIRCEKTGDEGLAFTYGLYDIANRKGIGAPGRVECKDVEDDGYRTFKVATAPLHSQMYAWVAPPKNPDNVTAVSVDRFWLVRER